MFAQIVKFVAKLDASQTEDESNLRDLALLDTHFENLVPLINEYERIFARDGVSRCHAFPGAKEVFAFLQEM